MKLFNTYQLAQVLNVSHATINSWVANGLIPEPEHHCGTKPLWSESQRQEIEESVKQLIARTPSGQVRPVALNKQELAAKLGTHGSRIAYLLEQKLIPEPDVQWGRRVGWTSDLAKQAVEQYRKYMATPFQGGVGTSAFHERRRKQGYYSMTELGEQGGVSHTTMRHHLLRGKFPRPSNRYPGCIGRYYTPEEGKAVLQFLKDRPRNLQKMASNRKSAGYFSKSDLCEATGISRADLAAIIRKGTIPAPSHSYRFNLFYTRDEYNRTLKQLKAALANG